MVGHELPHGWKIIDNPFFFQKIVIWYGEKIDIAPKQRIIERIF
jgi:hypothetical protein